MTRRRIRDPLLALKATAEERKKKKIELAKRRIAALLKRTGAKDPAAEKSMWERICEAHGTDPFDVDAFKAFVKDRRRRLPKRFVPQRPKPTAPPESEPFDLKPRPGETVEDRERNSYELVKRLERMNIPVPRELAISSATRSKFERPHPGDPLRQQPNQATDKQPSPQKPQLPRKPSATEQQRRDQQDRALRQAGVPIAFHAPWGSN